MVILFFGTHAVIVDVEARCSFFAITLISIATKYKTKVVKGNYLRGIKTRNRNNGIR